MKRTILTTSLLAAFCALSVTGCGESLPQKTELVGVVIDKERSPGRHSEGCENLIIKLRNKFAGDDKVYVADLSPFTRYNCQDLEILEKNIVVGDEVFVSYNQYTVHRPTGEIVMMEGWDTNIHNWPVYIEKKKGRNVPPLKNLEGKVVSKYWTQNADCDNLAVEIRSEDGKLYRAVLDSSRYSCQDRGHINTKIEKGNSLIIIGNIFEESKETGVTDVREIDALSERSPKVKP